MSRLRARMPIPENSGWQGLARPRQRRRRRRRQVGSRRCLARQGRQAAAGRQHRQRQGGELQQLDRRALPARALEGPELRPFDQARDRRGSGVVPARAPRRALARARPCRCARVTPPCVRPSGRSGTAARTTWPSRCSTGNSPLQVSPASTEVTMSAASWRDVAPPVSVSTWTRCTALAMQLEYRSFGTLMQ